MRSDRISTLGLGTEVRYLDRQLERISALNGQIEENMTRGYGWRLLTLGRRMERAQWVTRAITPLVSTPVEAAHLYLLLY